MTTNQEVADLEVSLSSRINHLGEQVKGLKAMRTLLGAQRRQGGGVSGDDLDELMRIARAVLAK